MNGRLARIWRAMTPPALDAPPSTSGKAALRRRGSAIVKAARRAAARIARTLTTHRPPSFVPREVVQARNPADEDREVLARAESILSRAIALGKSGDFTVVPALYSISATENCNLACIMCPGHTRMSGPALSLAQTEMLFASMNSNSADFGTPVSLDVTAGEPTLNRELHLIFRMFKERFPAASISIISNATLPVRGRIKEIFERADEIGLSVDGATAETYERIRRGSRFDNVIRNVRDIARLKDGKVFVVFVAMDQNIHEMPAMVRLCAELGVRTLLVQAVERRSTPFLLEGDNMDFTMAPEKVQALLDEAAAEQARTGVIFSPTPGMLARGRHAAAADPSSSPIEDRRAVVDGIKLCHVPWTCSPQMNHGDEGLAPAVACCHMTDYKLSGRLATGEHDGKSIGEIFNSEQYWRIREGLLNGFMAQDACRRCQYYDSYQWTAPQLREMEAAVERALERKRSALQ